MSVFDTAMNTVFTDKNLGVNAVYTPVTGSVKTIRAVVRTPSEIIDGGRLITSAIYPAYLIDIKVADVPNPVEGDTVTINGEVFTVRAPQHTAEKLIWQLDVDKQ